MPLDDRVQSISVKRNYSQVVKSQQQNPQGGDQLNIQKRAVSVANHIRNGGGDPPMIAQDSNSMMQSPTKNYQAESQKSLL